MPVLLVGLNHHTAPVALREQLYIGGSALPRFLSHLLGMPGVSETVVLSTCNRTEVYAFGNYLHALIEALAAHAQLPMEEITPHLYVHEGGLATSHLFTVACGLDSLVPGEPQILGQVREAMETARACGAAGRQLTGLFQQAIATGKRARTETCIGEGAFSIGRAAVDLACALFPTLQHSQVLLLGAGKMSELTAKHLAANGVHSIFVANRTFAHAQDLAERLDGKAIHYQDLQHYLSEVDIVISSTSAPHHVIFRENVEAAIAARNGRPLCLIDIAIPRDIDPEVSQVAGAHLYNIDDLQAITAQDHYRRLAEVPRVEAIIEQELERWRQWQAGLEAGPVISALHDTFDRVRRAELDRLSSELATLSKAQYDTVNYLTSAIIKKLLHTPTTRLKELLAQQPDRLPLSVLCELFDIGNDDREEVAP